MRITIHRGEEFWKLMKIIAKRIMKDEKSLRNISQPLSDEYIFDRLFMEKKIMKENKYP